MSNVRSHFPIGQEGYCLGQLLTDWVRAKQIMQRVKKWHSLGYYVRIDDLTGDEAGVLERHLPPQQVGGSGKNGYECMVIVYGPRCKTFGAHKFFVVQIGATGEPHVSIPLSKEQAQRSAKTARGVKSYVCEVIDSVDHSAKGDASSIYSTRLVD